MTPQDLTNYTDWPQARPPLYEPAEMARARQRFRELTAEIDILHLVYVDAEGAPVSGPARYEAQQGEDRPILRLDNAAPEFLARFQGDEGLPVSVSIYRPVGFENRQQLRSTQIQGVASLDATSGPRSVSIRPIHIAWHDAELRPPRASLVFEG